MTTTTAQEPAMIHLPISEPGFDRVLNSAVTDPASVSGMTDDELLVLTEVIDLCDQEPRGRALALAVGAPWQAMAEAVWAEMETR